MKRIKLDRLALSNFKGFTFDFTPSGEDADVYGANATGKTTLADAFAWVLFGKDSLGRADFEIKNLDAAGQQKHGLDHSVEATLSVDGHTVTLKKVYREKWVKERGKAERIYSGNTVDHFINGVPCKEGEYKGQVADLAGEESIFRLLTSPMAFPTLHWQKQRALLLEICGDLTDAQVIESDSALIPLLDILENRTLEDHRKVIAARRSEINKALEKIPVRIDEVRRGIPDVTGLDLTALEADVKKLELALTDARIRLQGVDTGTGVVELLKQVAQINNDLQALELKHYGERMRVANETGQRIDELKAQKEREVWKVRSMQDGIAAKERQIAALEPSLEKLRSDFFVVRDTTFTDSTNDTCPACGQALPAERVEAARTKAREDFNRDKAERLTEIEQKGQTLKAEKERIQKEIEALRATEISPVDVDGDIERLTAEWNRLKVTATDYSEIEGYAALQEKKAAIQNEIATANLSVSVDKSKIQYEVGTLEAQVSTVRAQVRKFTDRERSEARVEELKAEEKALAKEYERLEKELFLTEQFVRTKVRLLTDRINSRFEIARFKLFDVQVNGGIAECCEITVGGIPYNGGLNNAARINAGLDVCRTLSRHYGIVAPIWTDNAEAVCELLHTDGQMIRLVVSEKDKALRVETAKNRANTLPGMAA